MAQPVTSTIEDGIAVLRVAHPPVNALSTAVRAGLRDGLAAALENAAVRAVVIAAEGRTFIAGADITEFNKPRQPPRLSEVIDAIERSPKPVVAAINAAALGGGLEVAMGCHGRVAAPGASPMRAEKPYSSWQAPRRLRMSLSVKQARIIRDACSGTLNEGSAAAAPSDDTRKMRSSVALPPPPE